MPPAPGEGEQGAVLVTVNVSTSTDTRAGDPGSDHMEDQERWDNLSLYFVYPDGTVTEHTMMKDELAGNNPVRFSTWAGTADLYAIAYATPQAHVHCTTPQKVYDLRTLSIDETDFADLAADEKRRYMQNLYAGSTQVTIEANAENPTEASVTLTRIIAKVDVQYDMADALNGQYTDVQLENMTFHGPDFGYFFPDMASNAETQKEMDSGHYVAGDGISSVNGRTYFYTYPYKDGAKQHKFDFTVKYTKSGETTPGSTDYTATFGEALDANAWYYVTLNVRGDKGFANGNDTKITLTSGN